MDASENSPATPPREQGTDVTPSKMTLFQKLEKDVENVAEDLPRSPLDYLIDQLGGPDEVAEMSGRSNRVIRLGCRKAPGGACTCKGSSNQARCGTFEHQKRGGSKGGAADSASIVERKLFQDGKKYVAIITDSASTGVSLQADKRVANQKRRCHFTFELPWSADKAVQRALSRSKIPLSNQESARGH